MQKQTIVVLSQKTKNTAFIAKCFTVGPKVEAMCLTTFSSQHQGGTSNTLNWGTEEHQLRRHFRKAYILRMETPKRRNYFAVEIPMSKCGTSPCERLMHFESSSVFWKVEAIWGKWIKTKIGINLSLFGSWASSRVEWLQRQICWWISQILISYGFPKF